MNNNKRNSWLQASDDDLLKDCSSQHYKASGPGGQHRNKVSSAIRLEHRPTGLVVTAADSRQQHENKKHAIKRLRLAIAIHVRCDEPPELDTLELSPNNKRFPLLAARLFDLLTDHHFELKPAAEALTISSSKLSKLLAKHPLVWQEVNRQRAEYGLKPLKNLK